MRHYAALVVAVAALVGSLVFTAHAQFENPGSGGGGGGGGSGDFKADGSVPMTGDLNLGGNVLRGSTGTAELSSTTDAEWLVTDTAGTAGCVLKASGADECTIENLAASADGALKAGAGTFSGRLSAGGPVAAATPSFFFTGDGNTGLWQAAPDCISFAAGGSNIFTGCGTYASYAVEIRANSFRNNNATTGKYYWTGSTEIATSGTDGQIELRKTGDGDGVLLDFVTADTLKIRNKADSADGTLTAGAGTFSGGLSIKDGATGAAQGAIYFTNDTDTGMYLSAGNVYFDHSGSPSFAYNATQVTAWDSHVVVGGGYNGGSLLIDNVTKLDAAGVAKRLYITGSAGTAGVLLDATTNDTLKVRNLAATGDGDLTAGAATFSGDHSYYGGMYIRDNATASTNPGADSFGIVGGTWTAQDLNGMTFSTPTTTVTNAGTYLLTASVSFSGGAVADMCEIAIAKDTNVLAQCVARRKLTSTGDVGSVSISCIETIAASGAISLYVNNVDSGTRQITVTDGNLSITQL